jgi:hypothetical protein
MPLDEIMRGSSPASRHSGTTTPTIRIIDEKGTMETFEKPMSQPTTTLEVPGADVQSILRDRALRNKDKKQFWPKLLLEEILTETVISGLLGIRDVRAREIATNYRKVLAILILREKQDEIDHLIDSNVRDVDLPLPMDSYKTLKSTRACFCRWRDFELDGFRDLQDGMTPLFLDFEEDGKSVRQGNLEPTVVLPFLSEESSGSGGYSDVTKIVIESRSHGFSNVLKSVGDI